MAENKNTKVQVEWKNPQGKIIKKKVTINMPLVRILSKSNPVSSYGLLEIANGDTPDEKHILGLEDVTQEKAVEILTQWAKIKAGVLVYV